MRTMNQQFACFFGAHGAPYHSHVCRVRHTHHEPTGEIKAFR